MTNREKFGEQVLDVLCAGSNVASKNGKLCKCDIEVLGCYECDFLKGNANSCTENRADWLNAEYVESAVDWSKVPVDTKILVREHESDSWERRHFADYDGKMFTHGEQGKPHGQLKTTTGKRLCGNLL